MPIVLGIGLAVAVLALYVWLCVLAVQWVIVPLAGWAALVGLVTGAAATIAVSFRVLLPNRARLVGPDEVNDAALFPAHTSAYGRDRAWPHYLARQAGLDIGSMIDAVIAATGATWRRTRVVAQLPAWLVWWPVLALPLLVMAGGTVGAVVGVVVVLAVVLPVLALATLVWGGCGQLLRAGDALLRRRNRALARCPVCFWGTTLPSYPCECGLVHRDVRPSRLGVLWHRCRCGRPMPTTVSRAGSGRAPQCPQCDQPLEIGSGVWTDVSVPVFGPVSAGKTSLIYASLVALQDLVTTAGGELAPRGAASERRFAEGVAQVRAGRVVKTDASTPAGLVAQVSVGSRTALLHTFDAAGEFFASRERNTEMRFLEHAEHMMVVVDPFSIPRVADEVARGAVSAAEAAPAAEPPEQAYRTTVLRLRDQGVRLDRRVLAVVVVKADLLVGLPVAAGLGGPAGADAGAVRNWLQEYGQDQLVLEAERDFATVGYFLVSSRTGLTAADPHTAAAPLRWLGERARLPLPAAPTRGDREEEPA